MRNGSWNAFGGKQKVCAKCIHHHPTAEFANVCAHSVHVNKQPLREQRKKRADQPIERWKIEWLWPCVVLSKNNPVRRNEIRSLYLVNSLQAAQNAPNTTCLFVCSDRSAPTKVPRKSDSCRTSSHTHVTRACFGQCRSRADSSETFPENGWLHLTSLNQCATMSVKCGVTVTTCDLW